MVWEDRWDLAGVTIDLTTNWRKVTLDHCCKWQQDFNGYSDEQHLDQGPLGEFDGS